MQMKPGRKVPFRLTERERDLIKNEALAPLEITEKMRLAIIDGDSLICHLTLEDLEDLAEYVAGAANHAEDEVLENELDALCGRIERLLSAYAGGEEKEGPAPDAPPSELPPNLEDFIRETLRDKDFPDPESMIAYLSEVRETWNRQPMDDMGGLSPTQTRYLLDSDWKDERGAISLNAGLTLDELKGCRILLNSRIFLAEVLEADGVKTTVAGNLTRKFVEHLIDAMHWPPGEVESHRRVSKVMNEADFGSLHVLRIVLELGRLVRRIKGTFQVTKKGKSLLAEGKAGQLYSLIFRTYFREFNLAYQHYLPLFPGLQHTIAYSFYMLSKYGDSWKEPEALASLVVLPAVKAQVLESKFFTALPWLVRSRILDPLESFGLLEERDLPPRDKFTRRFETRKTKIFDEFIRFNL